MTKTASIGPEDIRRVLSHLRTRNPLVQCITNYVAMNYAANVLLAADASPAMIHAAEEAGDFAAIAGALTVNIGTLSPAWAEGMHAAVTGAQTAGRPWVLDPVAHFATPYRAKVAADLLVRQPRILRGNASEILAFTGAESAGRGVDSGDSVAVATTAARSLAARHGCVVVVTGAEDYVTDGHRAATVCGGSPLMGKVTAMGCGLTALMGAVVAVEDDAFAAAVAGCALFAEAGERAAREARGPGSMAWRFLDALAATGPEAVRSDRVRVS